MEEKRVLRWMHDRTMRSGSSGITANLPERNVNVDALLIKQLRDLAFRDPAAVLAVRKFVREKNAERLAATIGTFVPPRADIASLNRWTTCAHMEMRLPDLIFQWDLNLRYQTIINLTEVPMIAPIEQCLGRRLAHVLRPRLTHQFHEAAQAAIDGQPTTIRYTSPYQDGVMVSEARVRYDETQRILRGDVNRIAYYRGR